MSLTVQQKETAAAEFAAAMKRLGLTAMQVADDFDMPESRIAELLKLHNVRHIEDGWVLRNYLIEKADAEGIELPPFTVLQGDPENYWFLDMRRIRKLNLKA
jgi:hypothetical protein